MTEDSSSSDVEIRSSFWTTICVFFVVSVASSRLAFIFPKFKLPLITGYLFVGIIIGPYGLSVIHSEDFEHLEFVTQFALAFIAFSAGSELYLKELRAIFRLIGVLTGSIAIITLVLCFIVFLVIMSSSTLLPFAASLSFPCRTAVSLLAASIMTARSPASAIAIVKELKASGPFTKTLLGVTVFSDLVVLVAFAVSAAVARPECSDNEGFNYITLIMLVVSLALAGLLGFMIGKVLIFILWLPEYLVIPLTPIRKFLALFKKSNAAAAEGGDEGAGAPKSPNHDENILLHIPSTVVGGIKLIPRIKVSDKLKIPIFPGYALLPIGYCVFLLSETVAEATEKLGHTVGLEPLLVCIAAGYLATNESHHRINFLRLLTTAGPYVFIPFFTLTGAQLNMAVFFKSIAFAVIAGAVRMISIMVAVFVGAKVLKAGKEMERYQWMTLVTQAGVSIGLASEVVVFFPLWGRQFQTAIISVVVLNQVVGPVMCKWAIRKVGEAGRATGNGEEEEEHEHEEEGAESSATEAKKAKRVRINPRHVMLAGVDGISLALCRRLCSDAEHDKVVVVDVPNSLISHAIAGEIMNEPECSMRMLLNHLSTDENGQMALSQFSKFVIDYDIGVLFCNFDSDEANLKICQKVSQMGRPNMRVVARVCNPALINDFLHVNAHPFFPFSTDVQFLYRSVVTPSDDPYNFLVYVDEADHSAHPVPFKPQFMAQVAVPDEEHSFLDMYSSTAQSSNPKHRWNMDELVVDEHFDLGTLHAVSAIDEGGLKDQNVALDEEEKRKVLNLI